jgi:hypothetical protein
VLQREDDVKMASKSKKLLSALKVQSVRSELDIFRLPPVDSSLVSAEFVPFYPTTSVKLGNNDIDFSIFVNGSRYLDLFNSFIYIKAQVLQQDGSKLPPGEKIAPSNLFLHSMFRNCCITVGGTAISDGSNTYPYQAWIQNQLSNGTERKDGELTSELYYKDSMPDEYDPDKNTGFKTRMDIAAESKIFEMYGRLATGLFQQRRYLPSKTHLQICLRRNSPELALSSATTQKEGVIGCPYKIYIDEAILYIRMQELAPSVLLTHKRLFGQNKKGVYPFHQGRIAMIDVPQGTIDSSFRSVFTGQLPDWITIGIITAKAQTGALNLSPFNFGAHNLRSVSVIVETEEREIKFDFPNNQYLLGYKSLFEAVGDSNSGNDISRTDYKNGNVLSVFRLRAPNLSGDLQFPREGDLKIQLTFASAAAEQLTAVVYGQFQQVLEIDKTGTGTMILYDQ